LCLAIGRGRRDLDEGVTLRCCLVGEAAGKIGANGEYETETVAVVGDRDRSCGGRGDLGVV